MKDFLSALLWIPVWSIRLVFIVIGLVAVPLSLVADGQHRTNFMWKIWANVEEIPQWWYDDKGESRWSKFLWFAIRNPTPGLRTLFEQPILEPRPNPDDLIYGGIQKSAHRWIRHGAFSEYWYLRAVGDEKFEFRIGWKFSDGTPGFIPTIQLRLGE